MQGQDQSSQSTPESSCRLAGKIAAITGAGQGIGRETVLRLAREGASIFASDIREDLLEKLENDLKATGATIATRIFDAARAADAHPLFRRSSSGTDALISWSTMRGAYGRSRSQMLRRKRGTGRSI